MHQNGAGQDVYKRQVLCLLLGMFAGATAEETPELQKIGVAFMTNDPFMVPVSYTHLDVYKRQVFAVRDPRDAAVLLAVDAYEAAAEALGRCSQAGVVELFLLAEVIAILADEAHDLQALSLIHI